MTQTGDRGTDRHMGTDHAVVNDGILKTHAATSLTASHLGPSCHGTSGRCVRSQPSRYPAQIPAQVLGLLNPFYLCGLWEVAFLPGLCFLLSEMG